MTPRDNAETDELTDDEVLDEIEEALMDRGIDPSTVMPPPHPVRRPACLAMLVVHGAIALVWVFVFRACYACI